MRRTLLAIIFLYGCAAQSTTEPLPPPPIPEATPAPVEFERPSFFPTVVAAKPPAPITGGTLLVTHAGLAVAAEPDLDRLYVVDLTLGTQVAIVLQPGDEPGRLDEDAAGRVHVALRRGGALVTIDPATATLLARRSVCPAPRGVAYDAAKDLVHVACAGGELVSLPAAGGAAVRVLRIERDLRDVIVKGDALLVSRFRSAELLTVDATGAVTMRRRPSVLASSEVRGGEPFAPAVAWRTLRAPDGTVVMLHQRGTDVPVSTQGFTGPTPMPPPGGGYGGESSADHPCGAAIVHAALSAFHVDGAPQPYREVLPGSALPGAVLAVDFAIRDDGKRIAVVSAGNARLATFSQVAALDSIDNGGCATVDDVRIGLGQAIAIAWAGPRMVVQSRSPAALWVAPDGAPGTDVLTRQILLSNEATEDTGHEVFHSNSGLGIACASCHPEGGEDGRVWTFDFGSRRTQSLRGGILKTAPFHWSGDQASIPALAHEVFAGRMGGPELQQSESSALASWLDHLPLLPSGAVVSDAVARGRALFVDPAVGCSGCHSGAAFTNNQTVDVGTGAPFQVPSLRGVAARAPYLHDGCAPTLRDRFGACGGSRHGSTSQLTSAQIDDLVAYLETL
jgi:hypothetical protein